MRSYRLLEVNGNLRFVHQISESRAPKALGGGGGGAGLRPAPTYIVGGMSRRQAERASRFRVEIEDGVRSAAVAFRDNDVEASVGAAVRLWWTSHLRGRRFAELVRQAYDVTQMRISVGAIERGDAGRREAMPYFLSVLRHLVIQDGRARSPGWPKADE